MIIIDKIISFGLVLIIGSLVQEKTMDALYPNRPTGLIRNFYKGLKGGRR